MKRYEYVCTDARELDTFLEALFDIYGFEKVNVELTTKNSATTICIEALHHIFPKRRLFKGKIKQWRKKFSKQDSSGIFLSSTSSVATSPNPSVTGIDSGCDGGAC